MKNRSNDTGLYSFGPFFLRAGRALLFKLSSVDHVFADQWLREGVSKRMGDPVPPLISPKSGPAGNRRFGTFALMGRLLAGLASVIYRGGSGDSYRGFSIN